MLIGRATELAKLRDAILTRKSLLVHGRAGAGKTALLTEALRTLPSGVTRKCLLCTGGQTPVAVWRSLSQSLAEAADPEVMSRISRESAGPQSIDRWVRAQTSIRLRGILRRAMAGQAYTVIIDTCDPLPDHVYRLFEDWVWSKTTPLIVLARGATERELGRAAKLFWHDGMRLELSRMSTDDLAPLLDHCIAHFHLSALARRDFREFVLARADGLPGAIVRLCEMALRDVYQAGGRMKLRTLAVDFMLQQDHGSLHPERTNQNA